MLTPTVAPSSSLAPAHFGHARTAAGAALIYLPALLLAGSALAKFIQLPGAVSHMAALGFAGSKLTFIASLEILAALLLAWPRTRPFGILFASAYLGGAICAHVQAGDYPHALPASILLALTWTGISLRYPQLASFTTRRAV
jgi:hypothetical protein